MFKYIFILFFCFLNSQELCNGTCLSEEETKNITNNIKELQFDLDKFNEINKNLELQIVDYMKNDSLNVLLIADYKKQLEMSEEMIKLVKPKWHENKYLWFFGGMIITSGSVYLAGQIK